MDRQLTSHHLEIMRRSLACGGLPPEQMAWILAEAGRLLDERDRARSVIISIIRPVAEFRSGLNELFTLLGVEPPDRPPGRNRRRAMSSEQVHR